MDSIVFNFDKFSLCFTGQHYHLRLRYHSTHTTCHSYLYQETNFCLQGWPCSTFQSWTSGITRFHLMPNISASGEDLESVQNFRFGIKTKVHLLTSDQKWTSSFLHVVSQSLKPDIIIWDVKYHKFLSWYFQVKTSEGHFFLKK